MTKLTGYRAAAGGGADAGGDLRRQRGKPGGFVAVSHAGDDRGRASSRLGRFPVRKPGVLAAGKYWLGYWSANTSAQGSYDTVAAGGGRYAPAPYSSTANPPASWPGGGSGDTIGYSLYATLGAAACPSPAPGAVTFESPFTVGSINGQQGWTKTGTVSTWRSRAWRDFANAADLLLRVRRRCGPSNAVTSGARSATRRSRPAVALARRRVERTNDHFEASFEIGSTQADAAGRACSCRSARTTATAAPADG